MDINQHHRIARIKKLSRFLHFALVKIEYSLWALWPISVYLVWTNPEGVVVQLVRGAADATHLERGLVTIVMALIFFLLIKVIHHLRHLAAQFARGDIFNGKATGHAQKALRFAFATYAVYLTCAIALEVYTYVKTGFFQITFNGNYLYGLVIFGLMYVLLWALEIGRDLNEESELTI